MQRKRNPPQAYAGYPKTRTMNFPDSTSRIMEAAELNENQMQEIIELGKGRSFPEFVKAVLGHKIMTAGSSGKRKEYREFIQRCHDYHAKKGNAALQLDERKINTEIHPLYDLRRIHVQ